MSPILFWSYFFGRLLSYTFQPNDFDSSIHLVSDFQTEIGCSTDWQDNCTITEFKQVGTVYRLNVSIPAGTWNFKINDKGVYYGRNNIQNGNTWTIRLATASNFLFEYSSIDHKLNFQVVNRPLESRSMPPLPTITLTDTLFYDPNGNMTANPADSIRYTIILKNETGQSVLNAVINHTGDPNVTYDPSSLRVSPLAFNDTFQFLVNPLVLAVPGILTNDFDLNDPLPNPPFNFNLFVHRVESNQANVGNAITTAAGGMIILNMDGSLSYDSTGINGAVADSIHYTIRDADGYEDSAIIYVQFNLPPVIASNLAITDTICAFEQQDTSVMTMAFTIMDDEPNAESAKIQICANYFATEDTLIAGPLPGGITAMWNGGTGTLMLMGSASLTDYETAIENVQYTNQANNPNLATRTICITVNDGGANSNSITRLLKVKPLNDCPTAVRDTFIVNENASFPSSNVLTNDIDPDLDPLLVDPVVINQMVNGGSWSVLGAGGFNFTHTTGAMGLDTLNVGEMFFARVAYTISDGVCMDSDSVIIKITGVNDAPVADSNTYIASQASILNVGAPGLLADDDDIDHNSMIMVAAVNGLPGNVGNTISLPSGADLMVNADGSFTYNPKCMVVGLDTFSYQIKDEHNSFSIQAKVYISVDQVMWFVDDNPNPSGSGSINNPFDQLSDAQTASAPGDYIFVFPGVFPSNDSLILKNDQKLFGADENWNCPNGSNLRMANMTSTINGSILLAQNDTIRGIELGNNGSNRAMIRDNGFTVSNLLISNTNFVNTTSSSGIRIVHGGVLNVTFDSFNSTSPSGEAVYLNNTSGSVLVSAGNINPDLGSGDTVVAIIGGTISVTINVPISQPNNFPLVLVSGHAAGTVTFQSGLLNATDGSGLQFENADGTYNFIGTTSLNGGDAGIDILNESTGTFLFNSTTSISRADNVSGEAFNLSSSNANVTYNGSMTLGTNTGNLVSIDNHDAGTITFKTGNLTKGLSTISGINIQNSNGGTISFNNPTITIAMASMGDAIILSDNIFDTINFTPSGLGTGITLTTTGTGLGFNATGGGLVVVTGSNNTINCSGGATALKFLRTTIGALNLNFKSISSTGGANPMTGIFLSSTGNLGGLNITGDMTSTSGGIISDKTGADNDSLTGVGIFLSNCRNIILNKMQLSNFQNFGILGYDVNGLTMSQIVVTHSSGKNGTNASLNEGSATFGKFVERNGLTGTVSISNCTIEDGYVNNLHLVNTSGSITQFNLTNSIIQDNSSVAPGLDGLRIEAYGTASVTADIDNCQFLRNLSFGAFVRNNSTGNVDVEFKNSTSFTDNVTGIGLLVESSGDLSFDILGCAFSVPGLAIAFDAISCQIASTSTSSSLFSGTIANNAVDNNNNANADGIYIRAQGAGALTTTISYNNFTKIKRDGIEIVNIGSGTMNATITGNNIDLTAASRYGISLLAGLSTADLSSICAQIGGVFAEKNTINLHGFGVNDIRINEVSTINIKGLVPDPGSAANVVTYLTGQNTLVGTVSVSGTSFNSCFPSIPFFNSNSLKK